MTPLERHFFARVHRKASSLTPEMISRLLKAFRVIAASLSEGEIESLIRSGALDAIVHDVLNDQTLDLAFRPVQSQIRRTVEQSMTYVARDLPKAGKVNGQLAIGFDVLDPNVLTAIRELDAAILPTLKADVRETVRQAVQAGLEAGKNPRTIARGLRDVIGLAPNQERYIENLERELREGRFGDARQRTLLSKRFKLDKLATMNAADRDARIETIVGQYRQSFKAFHSETVSRTSVLDSFKRGQRLSWTQAIDAGIVDGDRLQKTWIQIDRPTKRKAHIPLNGETVPFHQRYSNGEMEPGETTYGCGCLSRVTLARAA